MVDFVALAEQRKTKKDFVAAKEVKPPESEQSIKNIAFGASMQDVIGATAASIKMGDITPLKLMLEDSAEKGEARLVSFGQGMDRLVKGGKQSVLDVGALIGATDEETANAFTKSTKEDIARLESSFREKFGDKIEFKLFNAAGQIAPLLLIPGIGQTQLQRVLAGTLVGAGTGGSDFESDDELKSRITNRLKKAGIGGAVGGIATTIVESLGFIRRGAQSLLDNLDNANINRSVQLSNKTGIDFKMSQAVDDPAVKAAEATASQTFGGARKIQGIERKQAGQTINYFKDVIKKLDPSKERFGVRAAKAFDTALDSALSTRKTNSQQSFKAAQEIAEASGNPQVIPIPKFLSSIQDEIGKLSKRGATDADKNLARQLQAIVDDFDNFKASPDEIQGLLADYGRSAVGKGMRFKDIDSAADRRVASKLLNKIKEDLDDAVDTLKDPATGKSIFPGADELKIARDKYKADSLPIQQMRDAGLEKIFGKNTPLDPDSVLQQFIKLGSQQKKQAIEMLSTVDPKLKSSLQSGWLSDKLNKARKVRAGDELDDFPLKSNELLKMLDDRQMFIDIYGKGDEAKQVIRGIRALAKISQNRSNATGTIMEKMKSAAGVAASRDATFAARLFAELFTPDALSKIVATKEGIKHLETLAKPFNTSRWSAALVKMKDIITGEEDE